MKFLKWLVLNSAITGLFLYGEIYEVQGATNVGMAFMWFAIVFSFMIYSETFKDAVRKAKTKPSAPQWCEVTYDLAMMGALAWFGYWVTTAFWALQFINSMALYSVMEEQDNND